MADTGVGTIPPPSLNPSLGYMKGTHSTDMSNNMLPVMALSQQHCPGAGSVLG